MQLDVVTSPRFDLCYAAAAFARTPNLPPALWAALPDAFENEPETEVSEVITALRNLPKAVVAARVSRGLLHEDDASERRQEWLNYIGVHDPGAIPVGANLRDDCAEALNEFAAAEFSAEWDRLLPALRESRDEVASMCRDLSFAELASRLQLRVEVDEAGGILRPLRGGYETKLADVERVYLLPSVYNQSRFWHACRDGESATLFFPYLIEGKRRAVLGLQPAMEEADPWIVCRALADPTRAAMVRLLAGRARTAVEITAILSLSKASISHHVFLLREAGLIDEVRQGRTVTLSLRRRRIDTLSRQLISHLFAEGEER